MPTKRVMILSVVLREPTMEAGAQEETWHLWRSNFHHCRELIFRYFCGRVHDNPFLISNFESVEIQYLAAAERIKIPLPAVRSGCLKRMYARSVAGDFPKLSRVKVLGTLWGSGKRRAFCAEQEHAPRCHGNSHVSTVVSGCSIPFYAVASISALPAYDRPGWRKYASAGPCLTLPLRISWSNADHVSPFTPGGIAR